MTSEVCSQTHNNISYSFFVKRKKRLNVTVDSQFRWPFYFWWLKCEMMSAQVYTDVLLCVKLSRTKIKLFHFCFFFVLFIKVERLFTCGTEIEFIKNLEFEPKRVTTTIHQYDTIQYVPVIVDMVYTSAIRPWTKQFFKF